MLSDSRIYALDIVLKLRNYLPSLDLLYINRLPLIARILAVQKRTVSEVVNEELGFYFAWRGVVAILPAFFPCGIMAVVKLNTVISAWGNAVRRRSGPVTVTLTGSQETGAEKRRCYARAFLIHLICKSRKPPGFLFCLDKGDLCFETFAACFSYRFSDVRLRRCLRRAA